MNSRVFWYFWCSLDAHKNEILEAVHFLEGCTGNCPLAPMEKKNHKRHNILQYESFSVPLEKLHRSHFLCAPFCFSTSFFFPAFIKY